METHVNKICQSVHYHLRNIGKIRSVIDRDTCKLLVNSMVTSRLDYCNSLLFGVNKSVVDKLQKLQNKAARIVTLSKKYSHITPILKSLHWLPVEQRIHYKILLQTFKSLHGMAPDYLVGLLSVHQPSRQLRSSSAITLKHFSSKSKFSERAFSVNSHMLWNSLPLSVRSCDNVNTFKKHLKTELFWRGYVC